MADWLSRRQRDGGIDRIPLPIDTGALWLCGKHAIGPDHAAVIAEVGGAATIVCLVEPHEIDHRYPAYAGWLRSAGLERAIWWPIHDLHAPSLDAFAPFVEDLAGRLRGGETLVVHCAAGVGRAGTTAVCLLLALGAGLDDALRTVASHRPNAGPEAGAQRTLVTQFAALTAR